MSDIVATPVRRPGESGRYAPTNEVERFWTQVQRPPWWRPWGCWLWTGTVNTDRYGVLSVYRGGRWVKVRAARYALQLAGVELHPSVVAGHDCHDRARRCHRGRDCRHRACVKAWAGPWWLPRSWRRPHVVPMTQAENRRRVDERRPR